MATVVKPEKYLFPMIYLLHLQLNTDKLKLNVSVEKTKCPLGISLVDLVKDSITVPEMCKF